MYTHLWHGRTWKMDTQPYREKPWHGRTGKKAIIARRYREKSWHCRVQMKNDDPSLHTLCTLAEFCTAAHACLDGLFFCVHFTSGILLACFPPWLLCATAVAAAAGSELSMLLEVSSNVSILSILLQLTQAGRQTKSALLVWCRLYLLECFPIAFWVKKLLKNTREDFEPIKNLPR